MEKDAQSGFAVRLKWIGGAIVLLWVIELFNQLIGHRLDSFGIRPRTVGGLIGIPLSPFLHGGIIHLLSNTIPLAVLALLVSLSGLRALTAVTISITLVGGTLVWVLARDSYHIGASGLIFGYFGYLLAMAWYSKELKSILIALVVFFFYGGIIWGVLPSRSYISWEAHLFGLVAGIWVAYVAHKASHSSRQEG